jgi:hypothetical protein
MATAVIFWKVTAVPVLVLMAEATIQSVPLVLQRLKGLKDN